MKIKLLRCICNLDLFRTYLTRVCCRAGFRRADKLAEMASVVPLENSNREGNDEFIEDDYIYETRNDTILPGKYRTYYFSLTEVLKWRSHRRRKQAI